MFQNAKRLSFLLLSLLFLTRAVVVVTYTEMRFSPGLSTATARDTFRDHDMIRMFQFHPVYVKQLKLSLSRCKTDVLLLDNDQLSTRKAHEVAARMDANPNMFAIGVGRHLGPHNAINYSPRYHHVQARHTKDAADAIMILLCMRLHCLVSSTATITNKHITYHIVSKDRVFEQLQHCFAQCNITVLLEES